MLRPTLRTRWGGNGGDVKARTRWGANVLQPRMGGMTTTTTGTTTTTTTSSSSDDMLLPGQCPPSGGKGKGKGGSSIGGGGGDDCNCIMCCLAEIFPTESPSASPSSSAAPTGKGGKGNGGKNGGSRTKTMNSSSKMGSKGSKGSRGPSCPERDCPDCQSLCDLCDNLSDSPSAAPNTSSEPTGKAGKGKGGKGKGRKGKGGSRTTSSRTGKGDSSKVSLYVHLHMYIIEGIWNIEVFVFKWSHACLNTHVYIYVVEVVLSPNVSLLFFLFHQSKRLQSSKGGGGVPSDILEIFCDKVCVPSSVPSASPSTTSSEPSTSPSVSQIPSRDPTCFICGEGNEVTNPFGRINITLPDNTTFSVSCGALNLAGKRIDLLLLLLLRLATSGIRTSKTTMRASIVLVILTTFRLTHSAHIHIFLRQCTW